MLSDLRQFLVILTVTLCVSNVESTNSTRHPSVLYVVPAGEKCTDRPKPCKTLQDYQNSTDIFSTSHTRWIFLHGKHIIDKEGSIVISNAVNVTLSGEESSQGGPRGWSSVMSATSGVEEVIRVENSTQVSIDSLNLSQEYSAVHTLTTETPGIKLLNTRDVELRYVTLEGIGMIIACPTGDYNIQESTFNTADLCISLECRCGGNNNLSLSVEQAKFTNTREISIRTGRRAWHEYDNIQITLASLEFTQDGGYIQTTLRFDFAGYAASSSKVSLNGVMFNGTAAQIHLQVPVLLYPERTNNTPTHQAYFPTMPTRPIFQFNNVTVVKCKFGMKLAIGNGDEELARMPHHPVYPKITLSNSHFSNNRPYQSSHSDVDQYLLHAVMSMGGLQNPFQNDNGNGTRYISPILHLENIEFVENYNEMSSVVYIEGFSMIRVVLSGRSKVNDNNGTGLTLNNSMLQVQGYNELVGNNNSAVVMTSDSRILLTNNSMLNITHNTATLSGGGIFISYKGHNISSFQQFVECYINRIPCPGWCFFQLVQDNGEYLNDDEIPSFNSSLNVLGNAALPAHTANEIFNGHFDECRLHTRTGSVNAIRENIEQIFPSETFTDDNIGFLPYRICKCVCGHHQTVNCAMMCNAALSLNVYPEQAAHIRVAVQGDFAAIWPHNLSYSTDIGHGSRKVNGCMEIFTEVLSRPNETRVILLQTTPPHPQLQSYTLQHNVTVNTLRCPLGMVQSEFGCRCNERLAKEGFECRIRHGHPFYRANRTQDWIGLTKGSTGMYISKECPSLFCNSRLQTSGVSYEDIKNNVQCNYNHVGLLCSECPKGMSVTIGFPPECRKCSDYHLFKLLLYAIVGIVLVVLLLALNFTVQQGRVLGMVFYINIMNINRGFYMQYSWPPLYFILETLSISNGAPTCIYHRADMLLYATASFVFPMYLIVITTVIIVAAHKCKLKILQVKFVAQRSVPMLATFLCVTYSKLIISVTYGLAYVVIENVENEDEERKLRWMFDPKLEYFRSRHAVLGCLSIAFIVFYLLPFTFILLFGDLLRRCTRNLWFMHFVDTFHGAFRYPYGFWFGVRMLLRGILAQVQWTTDFPKFAFVIALSVLLLWFLQTILKPFKEEESVAVKHSNCCFCGGRFNLPCRLWHKLLNLQPEKFDSLFLVNSIVLAICGTISKEEGIPSITVHTVVNASIVVALLEIILIWIIHAYRFFPVPRFVKRWFVNKFRQEEDATTDDLSPDEIMERHIPSTELLVYSGEEDRYGPQEQRVREGERLGGEDSPSQPYARTPPTCSSVTSTLSERLLRNN